MKRTNQHYAAIAATVLALTATPALGSNDIYGRITDERTGEPLVGARVSYGKGGVISDIEGRFHLRIDALPAHVSIEYLGYQEQSLRVESAQDSVLVKLREEEEELEEVVVVGYGTQQRQKLTGAVSSVGSEVFELSVAPTLDAALSGQVAGLVVTASSGQPGAASQLRIRGGNSVNANNEPLYVIDGFIYYKDASAQQTGLGAIESSLSPLATVNPADIESIEVLKDVSATAIYGSRGANGVVIVTTRKGQRGKTAINYGYSIGLDQATKQLKLMNATQWATLQKQYFGNKGGYTDEQIAQLGKGTDWQDAMLRNALRQTHELSISGGGDKGRYAFSVNYTDQEGIIINSGFNRYNFHLNADYELRPGLTFGVQATYGRSRQEGLTTTEEVNYNSSPYSAGITNSFVYGLLTPPVVPIYNADGSYNYANPYEYAYFAIGSQTANAVSDLRNSVAESINDYLLSNVWAQYRWGDLTARVSVGLNKEKITQNYFSPSYTSLGLANNGLGGIGNRQNETWQQEYTLSYARYLGANHYIDALAGFTRQTSQTNYNSVLVTHFTNEELKHNNLADGSEVYPPKSGQSESTLSSWIARVNYSLLGRYNATATLRADHSSRFASSHRWGIFPSLGLSWNIDQERFLQQSRLISALKLRASVGTVGNQEIGDYEYSLSYTAGQYDGQSSYSKQTDANDNLKWETTTSYNIGLDASLFHGRLNLTADYYYKRTADLLLSVPVGFAQGVGSQLQNVGNVENRGIELSIDGVLIKKRRLEWTAQATLAHNHNEVSKTGPVGDVIQGAQSEFILRQGEALGSFYGLIFDGIVQEGEDVSQLATINSATPRPGDVKYVDVDGNGRIDGKDRQVLGSIQPKLSYGFGTQLRWRQWDFNVQFSGQWGGKVFNALRRRLETTGDSYNVLESVADSWTPEQGGNTLPLASRDRTTSYIDSRYVESSSYLKLRNLTLGYTLPLNKPYIQSLRLYLTAQNLLTLTSYEGYDPEVSSGADYGAYPQARSFVAGLRISF